MRHQSFGGHSPPCKTSIDVHEPNAPCTRVLPFFTEGVSPSASPRRVFKKSLCHHRRIVRIVQRSHINDLSLLFRHILGSPNRPEILGNLFIVIQDRIFELFFFRSFSQLVETVGGDSDFTDADEPTFLFDPPYCLASRIESVFVVDRYSQPRGENNDDCVLILNSKGV